MDEARASLAVWELRHDRAYAGNARREEFLSQMRELWSEAEVVS